MSDDGGLSMSHHVAMTANVNCKELLSGLEVKIPDLRGAQRMLENMVRRRKLAEKAEMERAQRREELKEQMDVEKTGGGQDMDTLQETVEKMQEQLGLKGIHMEELKETEQCVFAVDPDAALAPVMEQQPLVIHSSISEEKNRFTFPSDEQPCILQDVFGHYVQSGACYVECASLGTCSPTYTRSLFQLLAFSKDTAACGAAFMTLASLLGYPALKDLAIDPMYCQPSLGHSSIYEQKFPPVSVQGLPTAEDILQALSINGVRFQKEKKQPAASVSKDAATLDTSQHQFRIQAIKALLHIIAAICLSSSKGPSPLSRDKSTDLLLGCIRILLDPEVLRLQDDATAAIVAILETLDESDWTRKLPQLADRVANMGPSNRARLRLLRFLPAEHPRGFALQQCAGCLLIDLIIPPKGGGSGGKCAALPKRGSSDVSPTTVISSQKWFTHPKDLAVHATSGGSGAAPNGGYLIEDVELLLRTCHLILWPHVLKRWASGRKKGNPVSDAFLTDWDGFLGSLQRNIKILQAEDQAVKALANILQVEYRERIAQRDFQFGEEEEEIESE